MPKYNLTIYDTLTGAIKFTHTCRNKAAHIRMLQGYPSIEELGDSNTQWVSGGILIDKTDNPATLTGQIISNIPNPSTINCGELGVYEVTDGVFEFTIDTPGTYTFVLHSVPHFDKEFTINVS